MCFLGKFSCFDKMASKISSFNSSQTGKGVGDGACIEHGFSCVKGKARHPMEDVHVAAYRDVNDHSVGTFAIYDGHLGNNVADYLEKHLFNNILNEEEFWNDPKNAVRNAYQSTDKTILEMANELGPGGSTAVTAITIDCDRLLVANVGDSRAVLACEDGSAKQLSVDHEPSAERAIVESRGGHITNFPGDVPRVDGQLAVARAFGDRGLKQHLSADPDYVEVDLSKDTPAALILASDGLWKVISNEQAVSLIAQIDDVEDAAKRLTYEAVVRKSKDDISCIVVRFRYP